MAVQINIHNLNVDYNKKAPEQEAAEFLRDQWLSELKDSDGIIDILTSVKYPGGATADIDIFILLDLHNYYIVSPKGSEIDICKLALILEVKDQPLDKIRKRGVLYDVKYKTGWKNASRQCDSQKEDLRNYITSTWVCSDAPFIYNFIWFRGVDQEGLNALCHGKQADNDNALPAVFTLESILQRLIAIKPVAVDDYNVVNSFWKIEKKGGPSHNDIVRHFTEFRRIDVAGLTQKRLNLLAAQAADEMINNENLSMDNLTIFKGRAGTGKTIKLLQYAIHLHNKGQYGQRCLLLTYNHALVADIRRLLFLSGISTKIDTRSVQIQTLHSFFLDLMCVIGSRDNKIIADPEEYYTNGDYEKDLSNLHHLVSKLCRNNPQLPLCDNPDFAIDWDYILIDEAQDWLDIERAILYQIYGSRRIVVADGVDQFVRGNQSVDWRRDVRDYVVIESNQSLRQKSSLTTFVNAFAQYFSMPWKVDVNQTYSGGYVDIMCGYKAEFHFNMLKKAIKEDASAYDILFLVPPIDVSDTGFTRFDKFSKAGIKLFDGTIRSNRERYSTDLDLSRVYQYDSCRGLEGWCVVCYDFDLLYEYKYNQFLHQIKSGLLDKTDIMATDAEIAKSYTARWILMPLTRAIDRLVITLNNPNSDIAYLLKQLANTYRDFVSCKI